MADSGTRHRRRERFYLQATQPSGCCGEKLIGTYTDPGPPTEIPTQHPSLIGTGIQWALDQGEKRWSWRWFVCMCGTRGQTQGPVEANAPLRSSTAHGYLRKAVAGPLLCATSSAGHCLAPTSCSWASFGIKLELFFVEGFIEPGLSPLPWFPVSCLQRFR